MIRNQAEAEPEAVLMLTSTIYPPRPLSIDPGLVRKAMVHLLGAAIAADGEATAGAWAPTLLGMLAGDVDIRVGDGARARLRIAMIRTQSIKAGTNGPGAVANRRRAPGAPLPDDDLSGKEGTTAA